MPVEIRPDRVAVVNLVDEPKFANDFESLESTPLSTPLQSCSISAPCGISTPPASPPCSACAKRLIEENGKLVSAASAPR